MSLPHYTSGGDWNQCKYYCPHCFHQEMNMVIELPYKEKPKFEIQYQCRNYDCSTLSLYKDALLDKNSMRQAKIDKLLYEW